MFKFILITLLLIGFSFLFAPYLSQLLNYFGQGINSLTDILGYLADFIGTLLNSVTNFSFISLFIMILLVIRLLFFVIDKLRGEK